MQLLLLSNSTCPGKSYLEHAIAPIGELLRGRRRALFVPFAGVIVDWDAYTDKVRQALAPLAVDVMGIHRTADAGAAIATAEIIIVVGGGNTFHLVKHCRDRDLLCAIRRRVQEGAAYIGWSAGADKFSN
ncbi:Peptidase E [Sodalis praecaptivus]|nr:Peptidase E [Sodalis praecaptivus]